MWQKIRGYSQILWCPMLHWRWAMSFTFSFVFALGRWCRILWNTPRYRRQLLFGFCGYGYCSKTSVTNTIYSGDVDFRSVLGRVQTISRCDPPEGTPKKYRYSKPFQLLNLCQHFNECNHDEDCVAEYYGATLGQCQKLEPCLTNRDCFESRQYQYWTVCDKYFVKRLRDFDH